MSENPEKRPFKFGVQLSRSHRPEELLDLARKLEALGFDAIYLPDHFDDQLSPFSTLGYLAGKTEKISLGTLVLDNDFRHPLTVAYEAATLHYLSRGRLVLGLGAGWLISDYACSGIPMDEPAKRVRRLEEALFSIRSLLSGQSLTKEGEFYKFKDARLYPSLEGLPAPRILIGGGSRRVLSLAAKEADIVNVNASLRAGRFSPELLRELAPERFDQRITWLKEAAGERLAQMDVQCLTFVVRVVKDGKAERERQAAFFGVDVEELAQVPAVLVGEASEIRDMLLKRRARWLYNYVVFHETDPLEELAEVLSELNGA